MAKPDGGERVLATNRKAFFQYHVLERVEAGIALVGTEVKSLREGGLSFSDSYVEYREGELFLVGCRIAPYSHGGAFNHEPLRTRKVLMHKVEIQRLGGKVAEKGYTLVPLSLYLSEKGKIKVELWLARGKAKADRRRDIMEREARRDMERMMKSGGKRRDE